MAARTRVTVSLSELNDLVEVCLVRLGLESFELQIVRDVLMYAQTRENSQGLVKIIEGTVRPDPDASQVSVAGGMGAVLRLNGNRGLGMVVSYIATEEVARLARQFGVGVVCTCNTSSSTGAIGFYAERLANEGLVGIVCAGSPKVMAAAGGIDPVFGTNPIAIAMPTAAEPLVLDMATASSTWFGLIAARDANEFIPIGHAVDKYGNATTDPESAMSGAVMPFGGHRGAGLAAMIEMLTGPLAGAAIVGDEDSATNRGMFFLAIDPAAFGDAESVLRQARLLVERVKASRRNEGVDEIRLPGEHSRKRQQANLVAGEVRLDQKLYEDLKAFAGAAGA